MFRYQTAGHSIYRRLVRGIGLSVTAVVLSLCVSVSTSAMSNVGPDPNDTGLAPGEVIGYNISTTNYSSNPSPASTVPIYFDNNSGTKQITIVGGDLCTDALQSAPISGGNYRDIQNVANIEGSSAAMFYLTNPSTSVNTTPVQSRVSSSDTCYRDTMTLSFNASSTLLFDPVINKYYAYFTGEVLGISYAENLYSIRVEEVTAIVGYSVASSARSFGVEMQYPYSGYRNYRFPFAPDCSVTNPSGTPAVAELFDLDNGDPSVQNGNFIRTYVEQTDTSGNVSRIPLQFTSTSSPTSSNVPATGDKDSGYVIDSGNGTSAFIQMTVFPSYKYRLGMDGVYFRNFLQFNLPYDSIYHAVTCPSLPLPPPLPPPPPPVDKPYLSVVGGDVVTGASFSNDTTPCSAAPHNTLAGVVGWNSNASPWTGSGGTYAVLAWGRIQEFATNQGNATNGGSATSLSFSNINDGGSVNAGNGMFGGMFESAPCIDYWGSRPATSTGTVIPAGTSTISLNGMNGNYFATGPLTINTSAITNGSTVTLYVTGNVAITGNITYAGAGAWNSVSQIPSLKIVSLGSIFIDANVAQLDGFYVAVPTGNYATGSTATRTYANPGTGTISTCSNGFNVVDPSQLPGSDMINRCRFILTINGSFAANQVWLLRTHGSYTDGTIGTEKFKYGPEVWLAPPSGGALDPNYRSIIGLPPIL